MDITEIAKKYDVRIISNGTKFCLNDIVQRIIESKSANEYMRKVEPKEKNGNLYYVTKEKFVDVVSKGKSNKCKEVYELINIYAETKSNKYNNDENDNLNNKGNNENILINDAVNNEKISIDNNNFYSFNNKTVGIIKIDDKVWFKAKDVAEILEYKNTRDAIIDHVKEKNKIELSKLLADSNSVANRYFGNTIISSELKNDICKKIISERTIFINEAGVYSLIFKSKKKEAEMFQDWVFEDVLPSIREKGKYDIKPEEFRDFGYEYNPKLLEGKSCIYVIYLGNNEYKFGITDDLKERMTRHKSGLEFETIVNIFELPNATVAKKVETQIKRLVRKLGIHVVVKYQTECFKENEKFTIDYIMKTIEGYVRYENGKPLKDEKLQERELKKKELSTNKYLSNNDVLVEQYKYKSNVMMKALEIYQRRTQNIISNSLEESKNEICDLVKMLDTIIDNKLSLENKYEIVDSEDTIMHPEDCDNKYIKNMETKEIKYIETKQEQIKDIIEEKPRKIIKKNNNVIEKKEVINNVINTNKQIEENKQEVIKKVTDQEKMEEKPEVKIPSHKTNCPMNCGNLMDKTSKKCNTCTQKEKVINNRDKGDKPSYTQLKADLKTMSYVKVGEKYGVSDNGIRKWIKAYEKHCLFE